MFRRGSLHVAGRARSYPADTVAGPGSNQVGRHGRLPNARLEGGCRRLAGTILMRMFGRPDDRLGRLGGHIIAHMNARVSLIR